MTKKRYVILGCSDAKFGDFVANHWIKSLKDCTNAKLVDIVLLDYGLTENQKNHIEKEGAIVVDCIKDGNIVNIRYRDMLNFLKKHRYEQVMTCDSGDIIFQKNIMSLFDISKDKFRAVCEDHPAPATDFTLLHKPFSEAVQKDMAKTLNGKRTVNGGLVIAPYRKFIKLCVSMEKLIINKEIYGPDQAVLNYILYKDKFKELPRTFNYIPSTSAEGFKVVKGVFIGRDGKIITIVHNAGYKSVFRSINNFGYGEEYNQIKWVSYLGTWAFYRVSNLARPILKLINKF